MRSKVRPHVTPATTPSSSNSPRPAPPSSAGTSRASGVILGVLLLAVGAVIGVSALPLLNFVAGSFPAAKPSPTELALATPSASAPGPSASPTPSPSSPTAALEAQMPKALNGIPFTVQSATDATSLGRNPTYRALDSGIQAQLGKQPSDLQIAEAYDGAGQLTVSTLGFRLPGVQPSKVQGLLLDVFLGTTTPGVTTANVTLVGTPVIKVTYADGGANEFVLTHGDTAFVIETSNESEAEGIVTAILSPSRTASVSPSPSPSGSASGAAPSASGAGAASPSASGGSSAAPSPSAS